MSPLFLLILFPRLFFCLALTFLTSLFQSDAHANAQWVASLFAALDTDADGRISFVEFQRGVLTPQVNDDGDSFSREHCVLDESSFHFLTRQRIFKKCSDITQQ